MENVPYGRRLRSLGGHELQGEPAGGPRALSQCSGRCAGPRVSVFFYLEGAIIGGEGPEARC